MDTVRNNQKSIVKIFFIGLLFFVSLIGYQSVFAQLTPVERVSAPLNQPTVNNRDPLPVDIQSQREAQPGFLIVCGGAGGPDAGSDYNECDFGDLIVLLRRLIDFAIFIGLIISTGVFIYAGFLYMFSSESKDRTAEAKQMIRYTVYGILIIIGSWILVNTLVQAVGLRDEYNSVRDVTDQTN
jgi:cbb3-type cytochrome oxidase subunit 3